VVSLTCCTEAPLQVSDAVGAVNVGVVVEHWMVALAPCPPIVGAVLSSTVMVWLTLPLALPQASTALQVMVLEKLLAQDPAAVLSLTCCTVAVLQVSDAVGGVNVAVVPHSMVILPPCPPIVGGVVSTTLTVLLHVGCVVVHPLHVMWEVIVYDESHALPASTVTEEPVVEPLIAPLPVIDQLYCGVSQTPVISGAVKVCCDPGQTGPSGPEIEQVAQST
jgi:hypothetical protein